MFDAVVIGSGYGGSVMAARLSSHARVLLVERGRRWQTGDFPTTLRQLSSAYFSRRNPHGLWGMRFGSGTGNAFVSAFGGASVVNYGITSRPEDHVFDEWPVSAGEMQGYFERASRVLAPTPNPLASQLGDQQFLDRVEPGRRVDIVNTIDWDRCTQCGSCVPGCNYGAKRSLDQTYLGLAEGQGATVETETEAVSCRPREGGGWELVLRPTGGGDQRVVVTRAVVLAAGTFGSLDFLLRNRPTLPTTSLFGQRMSMNGDSLAFLYNTDHRLSGHHGAPISTTVRLPFVDSEGRTRTLTIMSGRIPVMVMRLSGALLTVLAGLVPSERLGPEDGGDAWLQRVVRRFRDWGDSAAGGALSQTFMYKLDAEDSARGVASFDEGGRAAIDWPDYQDEPILRFAAERLEHWGREVGGTVVRDLGTWPGLRSFGVHPLGGCRMGASPDDGVVDKWCRLMRPDGGVYPGVRVVDASVLPTALGVPSSWTIAALAERVADHLIGELIEQA